MTVLASHKYQIANIQYECRENMERCIACNPVEKDVEAIRDIANGKADEYGGSLEFIIGDFEVRERNGKTEARCGGVAKVVALEASKRGFEVSLELEIISPTRAHYYALLTRDGCTYRIDGQTGNLSITPVRTE